MTTQQLKKATIRFAPILVNGFRSIITPLLNIAFSYIVVTYFSKELWGHFVEYLLFFFVASTITNWGSKTYLMRAFSKTPKAIVKDWQQFFLVRLPLCILCIGVITITYPLHIFIYLTIWLLFGFIHNSFIAVIYYHRDYLKAISIEVIGFLALTLQLIILKYDLNINLLIQSYALSIVVKTIVTVFYYYKFLKFKTLAFNFNLLKLSFPFFLLGISGFLQSKIDVYAFNIFFEGQPLGEYQIISGFFIFSQSVVMLILFPYVKNIYRMSSKSIHTLKRSIAFYGFLLNSIIVINTYFLLSIFEIQLSIFQLILGFIIGYPCYIYTIDIFVYFKTFKEYTVIKVSIISLIINFLLSILLLYLGYAITGVLAANAIAQIFALSYYLCLRKKQSVNPI